MTQTTKSSRKGKNVENTASSGPQQTDNPLPPETTIANLVLLNKREREIKRIWNLEGRGYDLLLEIVYNWQVCGKPSTIYGLCGDKVYSLNALIRWHVHGFVDKGLVVYYGKAGHGKYWAPTRIALELFGVSETFVEVCA